MGWTKRIKVPAQHKTFAASYRFGFTEGEAGLPMKQRGYFSNDGAWQAYKDGYAAGDYQRSESKSD